jgi:hypothetical protein
MFSFSHSKAKAANEDARRLATGEGGGVRPGVATEPTPSEQDLID